MEEFSMSENAKDLIQQEIDRNPFLVLSKLVYQQIYREIINGNLLPQHRIVESKIAKELNVSRSPVKMALAEMTEKGILEKVKGKCSTCNLCAEDVYRFEFIPSSCNSVFCSCR